MRIAVLELYEHLEVVAYLVRVLEACGGEVDVFAAGEGSVTATLPRVVEPVNLRWGRAAAVRALLPRLADYDLVINVTTMVEVAPFFALAPLPTPKVTLVHNARWLLDERLTWQPPRPSALLRRVKWTLGGELSARRSVAAAFDGLVFPSADVAERFATTFDGPAVGVPWAVWSSHAAPAVDPAERVRRREIVVPGTVLPRQRDYRLLARAVAALPGEIGPVVVHVLGKASGGAANAALQEVSRHLRPGDQLVSYADPVPGGDYAAAWRRAAAIVSLTGDQLPFATTYEGGGVSKVTGVENDQIRFARSLILPSAYRGQTVLHGWQRTFRDAAGLTELLAAELTNAAPPAAPPPPSLGLGAHATVWGSFLAAVIARARERY